MTDLNPLLLNRRRCLSWAALALPALAQATSTAAPTPAPAPASGAARIQPLALRSTLMDVALAGQRLVAVGERGHVLLSDDRGQQWRQAREVPTRSLLNCVHASSATVLWAAGHGGVLLRSIDAGEHWQKVNTPAQAGDTWLTLKVQAQGPSLLLGSFGAALRSDDGGQHWTRTTLLDGEAGERHLNRLFVSAAGSWLVAAEGGLLLRSTDQGQRWTAVASPYKGSLWQGAEVGESGQSLLLACGMRGNLVRSRDDGLSWTATQVPNASSLTGMAVQPGRFVLVGLDGTLVTGRPDEERLQLVQMNDRTSLHGALALDERTLLLATAAGPRTINWPGAQG